MAIKVAINGFGRIGKLVARAAFERGFVGKKFDIVAINDTHDPKLSAHLFKYDTTQGHYAGSAKGEQGKMTIDGHEIIITADRDPANLPWGKLGVDLVLECTGAFTDREGSSKHLQAGAKKVLISAPCKSGEADATIVLGVNDGKYDKKLHSIVSLGSCTTNCLAPVAKTLVDNFGIENGFMTTVHAYTNDQLMLDGHHKDFRRARAGAVNIIPTTTGAAKAIGEVIPELKGKLDGLALRVPTPVGSINDLSCTLTKAATKEEIGAALKKASQGRLKGIMDYCEEPIVSSDIIHNPASSVVDGLSTIAIGKTAKVLSWYDNEWGFSNRMVELAAKMF
ncbi:MAG: type I glyceraldehyde-3-phosphate dehydrogenase [Candidatus Micrarchaeota archaeon]|nr:type I glyceraldehyde-3-phosphate dehydrogenase [Candidatus Micrarchaeota archaeon]